MQRVFASLLFVGLLFATGCKKETPKESPEPTTSAQPSKLLPKSVPAATECQKLCMMVGKCAMRDGKCYAASAEACRTAIGCKVAGLCDLRNGKCIAATDASCAKCDLCGTQGRCLAVNGKCENKAIAPAGSASAAGSSK